MSDQGGGGSGGLGLWKAAGLATLISVGVNVALYFIGDALGAFPPDALVPNQGRPLTVGPVIMLSAAGPLVGAAIYAGLRRFLDRAWPVFLGIAVVVLVVMAYPPFTIENVPTAQVVVLQVMHLVTAAATLGMLSRTR